MIFGGIQRLLYVSVGMALALGTFAHAAGQYVDTNASCVLCHQATPLQSDFCSTAPTAVWNRDDKHKRAFYLLHETDPADPQKGAAKRELVRRILGFDLREAFLDERFLRLKGETDAEAARKVATVKSCLRCHSTWPKEADERFASTPPVALNLGVSCQACHGPGEKWDLPHRLVAWRAVTPAAKESLGFADCRSPTAKAKLCASCHVGNVAAEKFVKHEWYAAGHPPLPNFELSAFESQMPAHWISLRLKGQFAFRDGPPQDDSGTLAGQIETLQRVGVPAEAIKASYREANFPGAVAAGIDPFAEFLNSKETIVGAAVVLEAYVRIVGDYAALATEKKAAWPELALYDCTACHHELRSGLAASSRPKRAHAPGRPPLATWPAALALLSLHHESGNRADAESRASLFSDQWTMLDRATTDRPFGDPVRIEKAAGAVATTMQQVAAAAALTRCDREAARRALWIITDPAQLDISDFYTARQAAWTARAIAGELAIRDASRLFFRGSDDPLALELPSGPDRSVMENLNRWLLAAARYDPAWFHEELKAVRAQSDAR